MASKLTGGGVGTQAEPRAWKAAATVLVVGGLSACATYYVPAGSGREAGLMRVTGSFTERALRHYVADFDPAMLALARRHDPRPHKDYWGRVEGWEVIDLKDIPRLGDRAPDFDEARVINALRPAVPEDLEFAKPFVLTGSADARAKALNCLTQAVYYEAGFEPGEGQMAVAQTVINRMRHPGYPKSICGVIYEGAARATGCQFSFACDGSMRRTRETGAWRRAQKVAARALSGSVMTEVGAATHFHTTGVAPGWGPRLLRVAQVGMHIFYRFGRRSGVSTQSPTVDDIAPSEIASLTADGRPPVVYAANAVGRLEPVSQKAMGATPGMGGPVGAAVTEPASAPIATAAKTTPASAMSIKAPATAASTKAIPVSSDRAPLEGLKTTVGAGSGAAS